MLICLLYGNCQLVNGIHNLAIKSICNKYNIETWSSHGMIKEKKEINKEFLKTIDLFIYQPIDDRHGDYSTSHIISNLLKDECKTISVPYVYNSAMFSTYITPVSTIMINGKRCKPSDDIVEFENKSRLHGFGDVFRLVKENTSLEDIIKKYRSGDIDFEFEYRWSECIRQLREREENCDIKVADFLNENKNDNLLFLTHNHPTTIVYLHIFIQILHILDLHDEIPTCDYYDIAYMIKTLGNHPFQEYVQHFNMNMKYIGCIDQYSKKHLGKFKNIIEWDKHTESEIVDYYMNYQSDIVKNLKSYYNK